MTWESSGVVSDPIEQEERNRVSIIRVPMLYELPEYQFMDGAIRNLCFLTGIMYVQSLHPIDIHHTQDAVSAWSAIMAKKALNLPTVMTVHTVGNKWGLDIMSKVQTDLAEYADLVITVSDALKKDVVDRNVKSPIITIPNGTFHPKSPPIARLSSRNLKLLFVGRLVRQKGLKYLIDALSIVHQREHKVTLDIVGVGPEESSLQEQCVKLGLDKNVRFVEYIVIELVETNRKKIIRQLWKA